MEAGREAAKKMLRQLEGSASGGTLADDLATFLSEQDDDTEKELLALAINNSRSLLSNRSASKQASKKQASERASK